MPLRAQHSSNIQRRNFCRLNLKSRLLAGLCPHRESNPDLRFRKPSFDPLNYGDGRRYP